MGLSLIAFDTDHVKHYVFGTDRLKEIRGASSLLDYLNRIKMVEIATEHQAHRVYANGGSGLFLVADEKEAERFGQHVQQAYRKLTGGGASISFVYEELPGYRKASDENIQTAFERIQTDDIHDTFKMLQWRLQEEKVHPPTPLALTTHPFLRPCDACGIEYATPAFDKKTANAVDDQDKRYCISCLNKRTRDHEVKELVDDALVKKDIREKEPLWGRIIRRLGKMDYDFSRKPERPEDFDAFRDFKGGKDYLGLIYADANNMGNHVGLTKTLLDRQILADKIDQALDKAICTAITEHLQVASHVKPGQASKHSVFPFDILLLGGDDICMVVPASVAMDVALTLGQTFREQTDKKYTLALSVVLAPVKYPFGLVYDMAGTALKFAKRAGADARAQNPTADDTRINFLIVTGGSNNDFKAVYDAQYYTSNKETHQDFYATLRPYSPENLNLLLQAIRSREGTNLGRTKLHQMREAIYLMNLTTSVSESLAVLRNWREGQRDHIARYVYAFAERYQIQKSDLTDPTAYFPPVIFPWFASGTSPKTGYQMYRTYLLDMIELYDFISREKGDNHDEG